jgi:hypothetical protein
MNGLSAQTRQDIEISVASLLNSEVWCSCVTTDGPRLIVSFVSKESVKVCCIFVPGNACYSHPFANIWQLLLLQLFSVCVDDVACDSCVMLLATAVQEMQSSGKTMAKSLDPPQCFADHKVSIGQFVAVHFVERLFFGKVTRTLKPAATGRFITFHGDVSRQDRPPNVKLCCAWLTEIDDADRHPMDINSPVPSFVLTLPELHYCKLNSPS